MSLGFLLIPFLIKKLGEDAFGIIVLAESTIVFLEIATISIRIALSRHATFSLAQNKKDEFMEYLSTGWFILLVSATFVFFVGVVLSYNFTNIFHVPPIYVKESKILFLLITIAFSTVVPNIVFWSVLYAKQRFDLINISASAGRLLRAVAIFILFSLLPPSVYFFDYLWLYLFSNDMDGELYSI
jgi:O-antigen/teichoic acid export membrane protein